MRKCISSAFFFPLSVSVHEQGHMDMEMIKLTSRACERSSINQTNSVSENTFSAVELKCDYWKHSLSSQAFPDEKQEFELNNLCL